MRCLIVGLGSIGSRYATIAKNLGVTVAGYDPQITETNGLELFPSLGRALRWKPDKCIIATPAHTHMAIASEVLGELSDCDVLVEKPLATCLESTTDVLNQVMSHVGSVYGVCNMRFHPAIQQLAHSLPEIGIPLFCRAHVGHYLPNMRPNRDYRDTYAVSRRTGGGVVLDGIHEIDYTCWLFGPAQMTGSTICHLSPLDLAAEDFAVVTYRHDSSVVSTLELDYIQKVKRRGCEVVGTNGTLIWDSVGKNPEHCVVTLLTPDETRVLLELREDLGNQPYIAMLASFFSGQDSDLATFADARTNLALAFDCLAGAPQELERN